MSSEATVSRPQVFLSYTSEQEDVARALLSVLEYRGIHASHDWKTEPNTVGVLWDRLVRQLEDTNALIALVCEDYRGRIGEQESAWFARHWNDKDKLYIPIFLHKEAEEWWRSFLDKPDRLENFKGIITNKMYTADGRIDPFRKVQGKDFLTDPYKKLFKEIGSAINIWWSERDRKRRKPKETAPSKSVVFLFGGDEEPLLDELARQKDALLDGLREEVAEGRLVDVGDGWGLRKVRSRKKKELARYDDARRHAVLVAAQRFANDPSADAETELLSELEPYIGGAGEDAADAPRRLVWLPSCKPEMGNMANDERTVPFEYVAGGAADIARTIRCVLGLGGAEARVLVQDTGQVRHVREWLTRDFADEFGLRARAGRFISSITLREAIGNVLEAGIEQPIIVTYSDKNLRAKGRSEYEIELAFREHVRDVEDAIRSRFKNDDDDRRVFRVFVQFQTTRFIAPDIEVASRTWPILRFLSKDAPVKLCPDSISKVHEHFNPWLRKNWPSFSPRPMAA